jgi:carboxyl-terminal processing protease
MTRYRGATSFLVAGFGLCLLFPTLHADGAAAASSNAETASSPGQSTNVFYISPGPDDGRVAFVTAHLLEGLHYSHHPFDDTISSQFLDRYLESLDPQHLHFLQSDLRQFEIYRTNLDRLTITREGVADTTPAFAIFSRFVERLKQRMSYMDDLLQHEKFEFDSDERVALSRHEAPYPGDIDEARQLWRQRLRYDYLQEKLGLELPDKPRAGGSSKEGSDKTIHQQIVEKLTHRYQRYLRVFTDWDHEDVMGFYLTALAHVYDPHSDYFNREQKEEFSMGMNLQLFGIGAELFSDQDGYCKIQRLLPGPAAKSNKIKEGDRIVAVAQADQPPVDIVDMSLNKVVQLIRGPKGTEVRLTIIAAGDSAARKVVSLIRDEIALEDKAAKGKIIDLPNGKGQTVRLGVIDLLSFYAPIEVGVPRAPDLITGGGSAPSGQYTSSDVARLLNKFKRENVNGVILDLRRNGGGSLEEAIKLTGLFIKEGPVVQVRGSDGSIRVEEDPDSSMTYEGPLIVLTSRFSASASEIVAGALQDYGRALIVGDKATYGKGTVQNLDPLKVFMRPDKSWTNDPGALKVTIRKFYRASGASTQLKGVMPDIVLPSERNHWKEIGESSLENAMEWDTIPSASFEKFNLVQPYLSELLRRCTGRITTNQDFAYIREDIEQYRKLEADKTVSLNEKLRLREKQEDDARQKARDKELLARREPDEKVYEITLKQAVLPGLPPPVQKTNMMAMKTTPVGSGLIGTNSASVAFNGTSVSPGLSDPDEAKPPSVDADMDEAERIMTDYISLLTKGNSQFATHAEPGR